MTQSCLPSGVIVVSPGFLATGMVAMFVRATVSRTDIFAECPLETKALRRFGVITIRTGKVPTGISVTTWFVEVSITAVLSEYLLVTKRCWAEAEYAKAKAKIINSKGRRYVFIGRDIGLRPVLCSPL